MDEKWLESEFELRSSQISFRNRAFASLWANDRLWVLYYCWNFLYIRNCSLIKIPINHPYHLSLPIKKIGPQVFRLLGWFWKEFERGGLKIMILRVFSFLEAIKDLLLSSPCWNYRLSCMFFYTDRNQSTPCFSLGLRCGHKIDVCCNWLLPSFPCTEVHLSMW